MKLLWRQTASFMMAQGDHEGAVKSLEELRKATKDDPLILAQLIVAYSQVRHLYIHDKTTLIKKFLNTCILFC